MPPANFDVVCHAICVDEQRRTHGDAHVVVVVEKADARRRESPVHVIPRHATSIRRLLDYKKRKREGTDLPT